MRVHHLENQGASCRACAYRIGRMARLEQEGRHEAWETVLAKRKGYVACNVTFDAKVSSEAADSDESGDKLKDAKVTLAESAGVSDDAMDPSKVS